MWDVAIGLCGNGDSREEWKLMCESCNGWKEGEEGELVVKKVAKSRDGWKRNPSYITHVLGKVALPAKCSTGTWVLICWGSRECSRLGKRLSGW